MLTSDQTRGFETALLLGAGASVEAGVPVTAAFAEAFLSQVRASAADSADGKKRADAMEALLSELRPWLEGSGRVLDIEAIYEALTRLDSPSDDFFVTATLSDPRRKLDLASLRRLRTEVEEFIRSKTWVDATRVTYLEPLLALAPSGAPLRVFSTNYDTCIEALCTSRRLRWSDGFSFGWDPATFRSRGLHVAVHKLHGSVLWYRDERGGYFRSALRPVGPSSRALQSFSSRCDPLLIFPARKESNEAPLADNLSLFRRFLSRRDRRVLLVVVGYSFRDEQVRRLVLDGLHLNRHLHVLLVDPNAGMVADQLVGEPILPWRVGSSDLAARVHVLADTASSEPLTRLHRSVVPRLLAIASEEMECSARLELDPSRWHDIARQFRDVGVVGGYYRSLAKAIDLGLTPSAVEEQSLLPVIRELACVVASGSSAAPGRDLGRRVETAGLDEIVSRLSVHSSAPGETVVAGLGPFGHPGFVEYQQLSDWLARLVDVVASGTSRARHLAEVGSATAVLATVLRERALPQDRQYRVIEERNLGVADREQLEAVRGRVRAALGRLRTVAAAVAFPGDRVEGPR